jgi:large subunit GTPase 1
MIQIVDGRDPLFFRCEDLVEYITEINPIKKSLLLINKSDLVVE